MANMSYCRFENTVRDLSDCENTLCDKSFSELSADEQRAARRMYRLCKEFIETYENDETTPEFIG